MSLTEEEETPGQGVVVHGLGDVLGLVCTWVPDWPLICSVSWAKKRVRLAILELGEDLNELLIGMGFSSGANGEEFVCRCRRLRFNPWVGKTPWRRKWQPTPVFLPGESHGQRSLVGYSPWSRMSRTQLKWLSMQRWIWKPLGQEQRCLPVFLLLSPSSVLLAADQANESKTWGVEARETTSIGELVDQEDGRLAPQNNHLIGVWRPGSFLDQRWGKVKKQSKKAISSAVVS